MTFFDDIFIYSKSWVEHLQHLCTIVMLLQHVLYLKESKCIMAKTSVAYLGHVISQKGVAVDNDKIAAIQQ